MNEFVHLVYELTRKFPKSELFGSSQQLRRSSWSIILNYIEGYARKKQQVRLNLLEISYGSLQEAEYLLEFSVEEKYIRSVEYTAANQLADTIGAIRWKEIDNLDKKANN